MLNTQEVKDLVRTRFGGSFKQAWLNKCYSNKQQLADKRNMAFMISEDRAESVDFDALAREIGCKRVHMTKVYETWRGRTETAQHCYLRFLHVKYEK
tara:strand:+ start:676 stop:966 length:291 start_codon:yes stop_codon:yes gene_type:complete